MKIGEFAKKYNINASTVRYYIDKTLITPQKENGQYVFDGTCMEQMERVLRYKKYKFSLEEIELLSYYEEVTNLKDKAVLNRILEIFHNKESLMQAEIDELEEILNLLRREIATYQMKEKEAETETVKCVPIEVLEMLYCPVCGKRLALREADLESEGISRGTLLCSCGYRASIADGMILCEGSSSQTPFKAFENIELVLAMADDFSASFRSLIEKAYLWMYQQITASERQYERILAGPFSYNFMLKYMKSMSKESVYIVTDVSVLKLKKLQEYFADMGHKVIYIAGKTELIPIKHESIDLYIDDFSIINYIFTYNEALFRKIVPLLKRGGSIIGHFPDYSQAPKSLENFKKDHSSLKTDLMRPKKIFSVFSDTGVKIEEEYHGQTSGKEKHFARNVNGEQISEIAYCAVKE